MSWIDDVFDNGMPVLNGFRPMLSGIPGADEVIGTLDQINKQRQMQNLQGKIDRAQRRAKVAQGYNTSMGLWNEEMPDIAGIDASKLPEGKRAPTGNSAFSNWSADKQNSARIGQAAANASAAKTMREAQEYADKIGYTGKADGGSIGGFRQPHLGWKCGVTPEWEAEMASKWPVRRRGGGFTAGGGMGGLFGGGMGGGSRGGGFDYKNPNDWLGFATNVFGTVGPLLPFLLAKGGQPQSCSLPKIDWDCQLRPAYSPYLSDLPTYRGKGPIQRKSGGSSRGSMCRASGGRASHSSRGYSNKDLASLIGL